MFCILGLAYLILVPVILGHVKLQVLSCWAVSVYAFPQLKVVDLDSYLSVYYTEKCLFFPMYYLEKGIFYFHIFLKHKMDIGFVKHKVSQKLILCFKSQYTSSNFGKWR